MLNFAIIGYGNIGKRHAHLIDQNPQTQLVAVCDITPEAIESAQQAGLTTYTEAEKMLAEKNIDVVCVCTPNYLHAEHSILALHQGCHVLCEKPMCMNTQEADSMIEAARAADRLIMVVKQNRYNPAVVWVKELLETDALGQVFTASVRGYWNRNRKYYEQSSWRGDKRMDGGCIYTQFSHFIDILYYLLGPVEVVSGEIANDIHPYINTEDSGTFYLRSQQGAKISFQYSTCAHEFNMEGAISLIAAKGSLTLGGKYMNEITYSNIEGHPTPDLPTIHNPNAYASGYEGTMSNHDQVIQNTVEVLKNQASIKTSAEEGREVVSIIQTMYKVAGRE